MGDKRSRYAEAFQENGNLLGLTSLAALSAALLNPLPLLAGLVAEATYLLFVPDSQWYAARLSRKNDADVAARRQQVREQTFPSLDSDMQARYLRLEQVRAQIGTQAKDEHWFLEVLRKLDYLLEKFLLFAGKEAEFRGYLASVWQEECGNPRHTGPARRDDFTRFNTPRIVDVSGEAKTPALPAMSRVPGLVKDVRASLEAEIADVQKLHGSEADENTKAVLDKRMEVLKQRDEGIGKIGRITTNLQYQLSLLEDTFGLINDQIRARSPEQVISDIDSVVFQTDSMTKLLEELAPFDQIAA